ncbi:MAG: type 4a pilus biogenesis protein PilO [Candidatus Margulisiibacteriota bacterium]|nr:type 4a pilus biogenesis protein PilO [Candidatus Margulisiibacteriota bacterium]
MLPLKLSDRENKLIMIMLGVVVFYLFYRFLLVAKWNDIDKLKAQVRDARIELRLAESKIKILEAFETKAGVREENIPLTKEEKALEVLRSLSQATSKSGLNLISIKPNLAVREGMKFDITSNGSYQDLYQFLKILRELQMLISIDEIDVRGAEERKPTLEIQMSITAYH